ncbi:MAG: WYL domain-containing transcriptional regulator [Desulfobacterales bacterium]|nr:WYL domain-containing transcriptional regulator [Desulfobacterales bacterium]
MRGEQLARQLLILQRLSTTPAGMTISGIMDLNRVSQRTAYRDLSALQLAGFPLVSEKTGEKTQWRLVDGFKPVLARPFHLAELLSLHMGQALLGNYHVTAFHSTLTNLLEEIETALPPETRAYFRRIRNGFKAGPEPAHAYHRFNHLIGQINRAVAEGRTIEIAYQSLKENTHTRRRIDPYHVWFKNSTIYIVAFCHHRDAQRIFVLDRISMLRLTDSRFQVPDYFDFEHFVGRSFGIMQGETHTVRIRISPAWARYVGERTWHVSQAVQQQFDDGIEITFRVAGLEEIRQWVLALGPEARVIEPVELRDRVRADLAAALAQYPEAPDRTETPYGAEKLPDTTIHDPQRRLWG